MTRDEQRPEPANVDLNQVGNMDAEQCLAAILKAFPGSSVLVRKDGRDYRAVLVDTPEGENRWKGLTSECRPYPEAAINRLQEILVSKAAGHYRGAKLHLETLMGVEPSPSEGDPK